MTRSLVSRGAMGYGWAVGKQRRRGGGRYGPRDAKERLARATQLVGRGDYGQAEKVLDAVLRGGRETADARHLLGIVFEQTGRHEQAVEMIASAIRREPGIAAFHTNYGMALHSCGRFGDAVAAYERSLELEPDRAVPWNNLGVSHRKLGDVDRSEACFERALALDPEYAEAMVNLGDSRRQRGRFRDALADYDQALALRPGDRGALVGRAECLELLHRLDEARGAAEEVLAARPDDVAAGYLVALIDHRERRDEAAQARLEGLRLDGVAATDVAKVCGTHALVLERLGRYDEAFARFEQANGALAATISEAEIDPPAARTSTAAIQRYGAWFSAERVAAWTPPPPGGRRPAFFVGFPRSGTTLLEQALCSHPGVVSLDEQPTLAALQDAWLGGTAGLEALDGLGPAELASGRAAYWEAVERLVPESAGAQVVLDKLPLNIVHLGLVHRFFPDALVLVALRDPRDCCLSCFGQVFALNEGMNQFLSLERTVRYYAAVMGLYLHYRSVLPLALAEVRYEDLVADLEGELRRLVEFFGLPWDDGVLEYRDKAREREISTPSYRQVVLPLYRESMGRWRPFERWFAPHQAVLAPLVEAFSYASSPSQ